MTKHLELNALVNILDQDGNPQFHKDKEAAREYFLNHVNPNTVFFHTLEEKRDYMVENRFWDGEVFKKYDWGFIKNLFKQAYAYKYRFGSFVGAYKFYQSYACKNLDGTRYLERFEDRVSMVALAVADGNLNDAEEFLRIMMTGEFQPATPTFLNAGRGDAGDLVSCFLLRVEDNMESIADGVRKSLQLSKRGGGVALLLTNLRESGARIKNVEGAASGVVPVMKILEDSFSYANQLGARQGAGAVYLHANHPDIMRFLDTKRENADEKIRIKTLSLGVVVPDIVFELARSGEDMYLFSPYDVEREYGVPLSDIGVTKHYQEMVDNPRIHKTKLSARKFFQTIAELQFESGYPYLMFEDTVNRTNPVDGYINMTNLCVAPETRVLTDQGYIRIDQLGGQWVNVWNGNKFSRSLVAKTGENQNLVTVKLSNGAELDVTQYHKFYVKRGYGNGRVDEVRTCQLKPGDALEKFNLPVVDSPNLPDFPHAYTAGLHTAEGTYTKNGAPVLRLYPGKLHLGEYIDYRTSSLTPDATGRVSYTLPDTVPAKYSVPINRSLKSRLEWLAGLIDGDGWGNGRAGIQIASINPGFLKEVQLLLTTLGVQSKISKLRDGGETRFKPNQPAYPTQPCYRIIIAGSGAQQLQRLGLPTRRVVIEPQRLNSAATEYIRVVEVVDHGRVSDTYCLSEPELHKVVFEGVRTGQCSEILQTNTPTEYNPDGSIKTLGQDISCNLGSLNIANVMENLTRLPETVSAAVRFLTNVSGLSTNESAPSVALGNNNTRAIGLGQMNLHGYLAQQGIEYGSEEALDFFNTYLTQIRYWALWQSNQLAKKTSRFHGFEKSKYATGEALQPYENNPNLPKTKKVVGLFTGGFLARKNNWVALNHSIRKHGLANAYLLAIPPTGNISYVNGATPSIHPVTSPVEIRKEGKMGRVYYPAPGLTKHNLGLFKDAYSIGVEKLIDTYAVANKHTDQGCSLTLFFTDQATTRDLNRAYIRAWRSGVKTIYYLRVKQAALEGTETQDCLSCTL